MDRHIMRPAEGRSQGLQNWHAGPVARSYHWNVMAGYKRGRVNGAEGGIMFYTDTNGQLPISCNLALYVLGILISSKPLTEVDVDAFNSLALAMDAEELDLCSVI